MINKFNIKLIFSLYDITGNNCIINFSHYKGRWINYITFGIQLRIDHNENK